MGKISIGLLAALFSGLFSAFAAAQSATVTISQIGVTRDHQDRAGKVPITQINRKDCLTEDAFGLPVQLTRYQGYALELWAGDACDLKFNRNPTTATCWQLASLQPERSLTTIQIPVRDLLSGRTSLDAPCDAVNDAYSPQTLAIYAMLLDGAGSVFASAIYKTSYKLRGPYPPDIDYVSSGDGRLLVKLTGTDVDSYYDGVALFCDPPPAAADALANTQTTTDNAGVFVPVCSASELVPGADASLLQDLSCGTAHKSALIPVANGLTNGVSYNIALAGVDTYGNVGSLSSVACQVPQARAGNRTVNACAFVDPGRSARAPVLASLLALGASGLRRSRRRSRGNGRTTS